MFAFSSIQAYLLQKSIYICGCGFERRVTVLTMHGLLCFNGCFQRNNVMSPPPHLTEEPFLLLVYFLILLLRHINILLLLCVCILYIFFYYVISHAKCSDIFFYVYKHYINDVLLVLLLL